MVRGKLKINYSYMEKNQIVLAGLVAIVVIGGFFMFSNNNKTETTTQALQSTSEVEPIEKIAVTTYKSPFCGCCKGWTSYKITNVDCEIILNTNCTILTDHMLNALDRFHNINFTCSIDGYGKLNNLIRINSNFEDIDKNIDILNERYPSASFHVNTVVQKDNINYLQDLAQWLHNKKIISFNKFVL